MKDGGDAGAAALAGTAPIVALAPAQDRVFFEAPGERRSLLDDWAAQLDAAHAGTAARYLRHARARLKLLAGGRHDDWLEAEEQQAALWGVRLMAARQGYLAALEEYLAASGLRLALAGAALAVLAADDPVAALAGKFSRSREIDARLQRTHAGPNTLDLRAELAVSGSWLPASLASSGQHKRVLLRWLAAQVPALAAAREVRPLVLVDELSAHLDEAGRAEALALLNGLDVQVWVSDVTPPAGNQVAALLPLGLSAADRPA